MIIQPPVSVVSLFCKPHQNSPDLFTVFRPPTDYSVEVSPIYDMPIGEFAYNTQHVFPYVKLTVKGGDLRMAAYNLEREGLTSASTMVEIRSFFHGIVSEIK